MTQIVVLDAGGQYCHLIARKIRELGVYTEVKPVGTPARALKDALGIVISGGPHSVYEPESPQVDPGIYEIGVAILGICYGHQLIAKDLGGRVAAGMSKEYGRSVLEGCEGILFEGGPSGSVDREVRARTQTVWMSHGDAVLTVPAGFVTLAWTSDCRNAAIADEKRRMFGLQFHPEVAHTVHGRRILSNFVFRVCGAQRDWDPIKHLERLYDNVRERASGRKVFFLVSGGIDSTVAFLLTIRALGADRVRGLYVDTGFMRKNETREVRTAFNALGFDEETLAVVDKSERFLAALRGVCDPEQKRKTIGRLFVEIQNEEFAGLRAMGEDWLLGQGTIYPDTIESGGTAHSSKIKTHHNRVDEITELIAAGKVLEPVVELYKDEVRAVGRELGLPASIVGKHPFPGPGLAIRCLCVPEGKRPVEPAPPEVAEICSEYGATAWVIPLRTVGVQGDGRTYSYIVALEGVKSLKEGGEIGRRVANGVGGVNRVVVCIHSRRPLCELMLHGASLVRARLDLLREVDAAVSETIREACLYEDIWQFPVGLLPLGFADGIGETVLLRPVDSKDGMTAEHVVLDEAVVEELSIRVAAVGGVVAILYDVTDKPPATIELE